MHIGCRVAHTVPAGFLGTCMPREHMGCSDGAYGVLEVVGVRDACRGSRKCPGCPWGAQQMLGLAPGCLWGTQGT